MLERISLSCTERKSRIEKLKKLSINIDIVMLGLSMILPEVKTLKQNQKNPEMLGSIT